MQGHLTAYPDLAQRKTNLSEWKKRENGQSWYETKHSVSCVQLNARTEMRTSADCEFLVWKKAKQLIENLLQPRMPGCLAHEKERIEAGKEGKQSRKEVTRVGKGRLEAIA